MIRTIRYFAAISFAAIVVLSCSKIKDQKNEGVISAGSRIAINATNPLMTKAYHVDNDEYYGNGYFYWDSSDALTVVHANQGTTEYVSDGKFTYDEDWGEFLGTLGADVNLSNQYDMYAAYPYYSDLESPSGEFPFWNADGTTREASIAIHCGYDNNFNSYTNPPCCDNLIGPFVPQYGKCVSFAGCAFEMSLNQATCLVDIDIRNFTGVTMSISEVKVTIPGHPISGWFVMDWSSDNLSVTPVPGRSYEYAAASFATNVELDKYLEETARLRMPLAPFVLLDGDSVTVEITFSFTDSDETVKTVHQSKTVPVSSEYAFTSGKEKAIHVDFGENPREAEPYVNPNEGKLDGETDIVDISDGWQY